MRTRSPSKPALPVAFSIDWSTMRFASPNESETRRIAASAVSISYMAVELGKKIFDSLKGCTVMLVGAGEMASFSARHLVNAGVSRVIIANRTEETARQIAGGWRKHVSLDQLTRFSCEADVVICSPAPDYVITGERTRKALAGNRLPSFYRHQRAAQHRSRGGQIPNVFLSISTIWSQLYRRTFASASRRRGERS